MTNGWQADPAAVPIEEALTLVVAERTRQGLFAYVIDLRDDAEAALRHACRTTLEELASAEAITFGPDVYLDRGEYLAVPQDVIGADHPVLRVLGEAGTLGQLPANDIPRLWFYAVLVGDDPENRTAFIRKTDPHVVTRGGGFVLTLGDALRVIDNPVFVMEDRFDLIVFDEGLAVLRLTPFEIMFRQADELEARADEWVTGISDHVAVSPEGLGILTEGARRNTRVARRLRSIYDRGHLQGVEVATIRQAAAERGLEPDELFDGERLLITAETDLMVLLRLLNEDLFSGGLTGQEFAADRKRAV